MVQFICSLAGCVTWCDEHAIDDDISPVRLDVSAASMIERVANLHVGTPSLP